MSNPFKNIGEFYLKAACFSICLMVSDVVLALDKLVVESDLNDHTVIIGESGYFFTGNVIYALDIPVDANNKKSIQVVLPDGSGATIGSLPFGLGLWIPARNKSKYDFWPILPAVDGAAGIQYKSVFEFGMSSPSDTYKLVYKSGEVVKNVKTGRDINWKNYHLCLSSSLDKDCLRNSSAITWKIAEGDIFNIKPSS